MPKDTKLQQKLHKLSSFIAPVDDIAASVSKIPVELIIEPNMPVGIYIQESFNIHAFAQGDLEILNSKGLNRGIIEELPLRVAFLQQQEIIWWKARFEPAPSEREFLRVKTISDQVSSELIRDFEYLAESDADIQVAVSNIKKGSGRDDYAIDLLSLTKLGEREKEKLRAIGSDPKLLETIKYCAEIFPHLSVTVELEQSAATYKRTERNQAYTFLLVSVEEIRRCAAHAFWNDKLHLKGYQSEYFRRKGKFSILD